VVLGNPFAVDGRWYKAAFHVHTTDSDGKMSPAETAKLYADLGYDLVVMTDHGGTENLPDSLPGTLVMPGAEVTTDDGTHVVVLGLEKPGRFHEPAQVRDLFERGQNGDVALIIGHPYWSHLKLDGMMALTGYSAVEVFNTTCSRGIGRGFSDVHWDDMSDLGRNLWALAVDDCHRTDIDAGVAWTMIKLRQPTRQGLLEAIHNGWMYASTGPVIHRIDVENDRITVLCDPVRRIDFIAGPAAGWGQSCHNGESFVLSRAAHTLAQGRNGYVRVQCVCPDGRRAWSNAFRVENGRFVPWPQQPYRWKRD